MIAIPLNMNKENSALSPLFGKAKYFAIANKGEIQIVKNEKFGGNQVAMWLYSLGVKKVLSSHMGRNPFEKLLGLGIEIYFAGNERILLKDLLLKYADGDLVQINKTNFHHFFDEDDQHTNGDQHHNHQEIKYNLAMPIEQSTINQNIKFKL